MITTFHNHSLLEHNTFGIAAQCHTFIEYTQSTDLPEVEKLLQNHNFQYIHIGKGSNLLFTSDYPGIVLHSAITDLEITPPNQDGFCLARVGAGVTWDYLVEVTCNQGLSGIENLSLIPGEVGAAAVQNIGAYGKEIAQCIVHVEAYEWKTGYTHLIPVEQCNYAYRSSRFKTIDRNRFVITHVCFRLHTEFQPCLQYNGLERYINEKAYIPLTPSLLRKAIIEIRSEKLPDPKVLGNAGSFFINPVIDPTIAKKLKAMYPSMPCYETPHGTKIPAAWLIEQCGWKGVKRGAVGVYEKQALVLIAYSGAKGTDIVSLANDIIYDVQQKFGIQITPEVNYI